MQRRRGAGITGVAKNQARWFVFALMSLVFFWSVCFLILASKWDGRFTTTAIVHEKKFMSSSSSSSSAMHAPVKNGEQEPDVDNKNVEEIPLSPRNLSRSREVKATSDVRGNLGPASVVVQRSPGTDWIHDRWQAASDMHGTAIGGAHWILLDFGTEIVPETIILDWEAAYSDQYRLEASQDPITDQSSKESIWIVFDSTDPLQKERIKVETKGQSPGVKTTTPLHVIHTLHPLQSTKPLRYLRLYILSSAMGWGVSLWQFDVIGYSRDEVLS